MSDEETKIVVFTIVARVPKDFYAETSIYAIDARAGWVDDIIDTNGFEITGEVT
jgi:hypothetical protein